MNQLKLGILVRGRQHLWYIVYTSYRKNMDMKVKISVDKKTIFELNSKFYRYLQRRLQS